MEDNINSLKRHRNESGQGEYGSQEKKPFTQSSSEGKSRAYTKRRSFSMPFSSFSSASLSSMETTCSSADETESMICDTSSEEVFLKPEQQKIEKLDKFSVDIKRGLDIARYEIKISYGSGKWSTIKEEMKLTICKYVRVAGNSLGGLIDVDVNAVMFPDDKHKKVLNEFYRDIELEVFLKWEKSERPIRESTEGKGLIIYVPMFKNLKSENTNVIDSGEESHPQLNDQMVQHLLETDEGKYESRFQRFASFEKQFDYETIQYNTVINYGSEATNLEFKLLTDGEGLTKRILKNKLLLYISAFGIRDGGLVMYGIEDATGHAKGQVLSGDPEKKHYFENIKKKILYDVRQHTVCLKRDQQRCDPTKLLEIICIPVINIPPEMLRQIDNENDNSYYAVIVIHIKPFDGIIFTSSRGPEAYKIRQTLGTVRDTAAFDIARVSPEEWVTEKSRKITTKMITNSVRKLNFQFTSAAEGTNVFELPDSVKSIREKIFKVSGEFTIYPEGFLQGRHLPVIKQIQKSFTAISDEGIILAELFRGVAVYLFIISKQCGLHFCMLPMQKCSSVEVLMETLSTEALKLKKHLFEIGGCQLNLVIRTHFISADDFVTKFEKLQVPMQDNEMYSVLDSYIRVIGSFPNSCLKHQLGVEVLNVLTEKQFQLLLRLDTCRRLWVHGLPGSGKTVLAEMMIKHLVKHGEGPVLFVAENEGLVSKLASLLEKECGEEVRCISRIKFVGMNMKTFDNIRSIIMDEVHHYRIDNGMPHWYARAQKIVTGKGPNGRNGYLWLFLDMFQKENAFRSGIPVLTEQQNIETLTEVIRCSCSVWAAVKQMLRNVNINANDCTELYKDMLSRSTCPHAVEGQVVEICPPQDRPDNSFGLHFQVGGKVDALLAQHWRPEDIGILFSKKQDADTFSSQYNRLMDNSIYNMPMDSSRGIRLRLCTDDEPNSIVCDSVRRFSGMEKPCIILVKPTVNEMYFSAKAFQALGMSRAMIKLIVITEKAGPRRTRSGAASALVTP